MTSVKPFKQENQQSNLYKKEETLMIHINKQQPLNFRFLNYDSCKQIQRV